MDVLIVPVLKVLSFLASLFSFAVMASVILSWLTAFNVLNGYNRLVFTATSFLFRLTEPALRFVRGFIPALGEIDLAPLFVLLAVWFFQEVLQRIMLKF